jgi:hypothetical protein
MSRFRLLMYMPLAWRPGVYKPEAGNVTLHTLLSTWLTYNIYNIRTLKYKIYVYEFWKQVETSLIFIVTDNVPILILSICLRCQKSLIRLPNCRLRTETVVIPILFMGFPQMSALILLTFLASLYMNHVPEELYIGQWPQTTK